MSQKIDTTAIYRSGKRGFRFSCYEIDKNDEIVLLPTGTPKKLYFQLKNGELRLTDPVKIRSIDAWIAYHTHDIVKGGKLVGQSSGVPIKKFNEAELLKLQEPEFIVMKNDKGEDVKVGINEMKAAYLANKDKAPKSQTPIPVQGTRGSQNTDAKGGK